MDTATQLSETVQALLRDRVHSIEELETLLLLRTDVLRAWTTSELSNTLRLGSSSVEAALANLASRGMSTLTPAGAHIYRAEAPQIERAVDELAKAYSEQRIEVLVFISQSAISRVRTNALRTFAQAFQISRGRKDG